MILCNPIIQPTAVTDRVMITTNSTPVVCEQRTERLDNKLPDTKFEDKDCPPKRPLKSTSDHGLDADIMTKTPVTRNSSGKKRVISANGLPCYVASPAPIRHSPVVDLEYFDGQSLLKSKDLPPKLPLQHAICKQSSRKFLPSEAWAFGQVGGRRRESDPDIEPLRPQRRSSIEHTSVPKAPFLDDVSPTAPRRSASSSRTDLLQLLDDHSASSSRTDLLQLLDDHSL
jgi:hypothetical protein